MTQTYGRSLRRTCLVRGFKFPSKLAYIVIPEPKKNYWCVLISLLRIKSKANRTRLPKTGKICGSTSHTCEGIHAHNTYSYINR